MYLTLFCILIRKSILNIFIDFTMHTQLGSLVDFPFSSALPAQCLLLLIQNAHARHVHLRIFSHLIFILYDLLGFITY